MSRDSFGLSVELLIQAGWSVIVRLFVLAVSVATVSGCYVYAAAPPAPAVGTHLLLEINDRGRVGLGDSIGSAAQTIEGTSIRSSDSAYALRVSRVGYVNGQSNNWTGEQLVVPRIFVTSAREQNLSKSRSWLAASFVTAAVATFISTRGILGFGSSGKDSPGGKPGAQ